MTIVDEYWYKFIKDTNRSEEERCAGDICFDSDALRTDQLTALVLANKKTAFFTSWSTYVIDEEPLPVTGELYVLVDRADNPRCIIELESVNIIPFNEVTWEMAKQEGEDGNITEWRERQQENLEYEGSILGFEFTPDIKLVFQTFKVIYK